jgi:hypothetical protein
MRDRDDPPPQQEAAGELVGKSMAVPVRRTADNIVVIKYRMWILPFISE